MTLGGCLALGMAANKITPPPPPEMILGGQINIDAGEWKEQVKHLLAELERLALNIRRLGRALEKALDTQAAIGRLRNALPGPMRKGMHSF